MGYAMASGLKSTISYLSFARNIFLMKLQIHHSCDIFLYIMILNIHVHKKTFCSANFNPPA